LQRIFVVLGFDNGSMPEGSGRSNNSIKSRCNMEKSEEISRRSFLGIVTGAAAVSTVSYLGLVSSAQAFVQQEETDSSDQSDDGMMDEEMMDEEGMDAEGMDDEGMMDEDMDDEGMMEEDMDDEGMMDEEDPNN